MISEPEIREPDIKEWSKEYSKDDLETPEPGVVLEGLDWIEKEQQHDQYEESRHDEGLYIQVLGV